MTRRSFLRRAAGFLAGLLALQFAKRAEVLAETLSQSLPASGALPTRPLGGTGHQVTIFGLGGEGVLRTTGRMREAVPVIQAALAEGVNYFDTAPAYQQSQDYLGEALGGRRNDIFLASKTHDRTRDGALRLLDKSLKRLRTDRLDLWQLHDLREEHELSQIFSRGGVMEAVEQAKREGRVRFVGITGHNNPNVLKEALRRFPFDTVLVALNPADRARMSFIEEFLPAAQERGAAVIGMKVFSAGRFSEPDSPIGLQQALHYVLSLPVSHVILGCSSPQEVRENAAWARAFQPLTEALQREIEKRALPHASHFTSYKRLF